MEGLRLSKVRLAPAAICEYTCWTGSGGTPPKKAW